jgi:hypothetical protein
MDLWFILNSPTNWEKTKIRGLCSNGTEIPVTHPKNYHGIYNNYRVMRGISRPNSKSHQLIT